MFEILRVVYNINYNDLKRLVKRWIDYENFFRVVYFDDLVLCIKFCFYDLCEVISIIVSFEIKKKIYM